MVRFRASAVLGCTLGLAVGLLSAPAEARTARDTTGDPRVITSESGDDKKAKPKRFCQGKRATIVGTRKKNLLIGTRHRDIIWAGAGADTLLGRGGKDLICGGKGADALIGGTGRDRLYGQAQRDYCHGENREHKHHYRCEVHLNNLGDEIRPPEDPTKLAAARPATLVRSAASGHQSKRAAWVGVDAPVCAYDNTVYMNVRLGQVHFQAQYTDPGYIAILPYYYRWGTSGFADGPYFREPWKQFYAPLDGGVYSGNMFTSLVPKSEGRIIMLYSVWWWNGAAWVDGTTMQVQNHYLETSGGNIATGGICGF